MATTYRVQGSDVRVPMVVEHATAGLAAVLGDADAIAARLPDDLRPLRLPGNRGVVLLLAVDYLDNPLGAYDEVVVGLAAGPTSMRGGAAAGAADVLRGRVGVWIEHMAVSEAFTRDAGEAIWGYPKTLDTIDFDHSGGRATCRWARDGRDVLRLEQPTSGRLPAPPLPVTTYTCIDGVTMATGLRTRARGVGVHVGRVRLDLGSHPVADDLAVLGLERRPLATAWLSHLRMRFGTATPLHPGT